MSHDTHSPKGTEPAGGAHDSGLDPARRLAGLLPRKRHRAEQVSSPFWQFDRQAWATLAQSIPQPLTHADVERLRGLGEKIDVSEVASIFLPLSRLLSMHVLARGNEHEMTRKFFSPLDASGGSPVPERTPFVIGVAGSVAVGKSTTARVLREMMSRWENTPRVELITTDGFLFPNKELERRGLADRKGFPESYDRRGLLRFLSAIKSGAPEVRAPIYSHHTYDIVPGAAVTVRQPDVLIVEGLNVLQPPAPGYDGKLGLTVSDYFDFSIYVHAKTQFIRQWYIERFLSLKSGAFSKPDSYFHRFSDLGDDEARALAGEIWDSINAPNLRENVLPTRGRAHLIMHKGIDHRVQRVQLRKL